MRKQTHGGQKYACGFRFFAAQKHAALWYMKTESLAHGFTSLGFL